MDLISTILSIPIVETKINILPKCTIMKVYFLDRKMLENKINDFQ